MTDTDMFSPHLPDAAAVLCLQGKLWQAHKEHNKAVECYAAALKLNPFMWDAFLNLCETGVDMRVSNIYKMSPELYSMVSSAAIEDAEFMLPPDSALQTQVNTNPSLDPFTAGTTRSDSTSTHGSSALWEKLNGSTVSVASSGAGPHIMREGMETPGGQSSESDDPRVAKGGGGTDVFEPPLAPAKKNRTIQTLGGDHPMDPPPKMRPTGIRPRTRTKLEPDEGHTERDVALGHRVGDRKRTVSGQVAHPSVSHSTDQGVGQRRSVRLFNQIKPTTNKISSAALGVKDGREVKKVRTTGTKARMATSSTVGRVVSGNNRRHIGEIHDSDTKEYRGASGSTSNSSQNAPSKLALSERTKSVEALAWILDLFSKIASGYYCLSRYKCPDAIQIFSSLSQGQRETPWVLAQIGRAYYEQAMYSDAEKYFVRVKAMAPSRLEDMEIYSTVLWHLKNDVELAYLAHELMEVDRLSPEAWVAVGNSFSHQRDHDQALKCFKRATQLDPQFAYGFTLQGHEYVANEEYDKALDAYRNGINADSRHYNAWYGLGTVYDKMGKLDFAEQHFRNAAKINPTNAVLICCIGLVLEKMNNPKSALVQYNRACTLAPHSVLARFRKARALMKLQDLRSALTELKVLKDMAPDEANVHYLLGKLYKMLRDKGNAIKHFTTALNLDPKAAQYIKDAMEALDDDEEDEEDMA
ncbi:anaphase promoting complex subunit bimA [Aspergillus mulundensis]|uniref:Protein bimA n=1 Tax=Aspergillus mulundensis TaxID=1810919 RepID=A0A3D8SWH0_9EURO|nr:Protein bimA [Aspergillus mulundensis]RDW90511.1 Protein bimA [Aspergillus mulundensis]